MKTFSDFIKFDSPASGQSQLNIDCGNDWVTVIKIVAIFLEQLLYATPAVSIRVWLNGNYCLLGKSLTK